MSILQRGFSASILILAIILIRFVAINRLPKNTFIALWAVVVVRALIPFSFASPLSVYSLIRSAAMTVGRIAENPVVQFFLMALPTQMSSKNIETFPLALASWDIALISTKGVMPLLMVTWAVGVILCGLYFLIAYVRFYRRFKTSTTVQNSFVTTWIAEHKILRTIRVKQSDRISSPLTYGIFHPVILMPEKTDWANEKELLYILMHEYIHICRLDTVIKIFLTAAVCLYWFNPLVWIMYVLANRDLEIACDEGVLKSLGETVKSSYALTLLRLEERRRAPAPYYSSFSKNAAEERIKAIMIYRRSSATAIVFAILLVVVTALAFAFSASTARYSDSNTKETKNYWDTAEGDRYSTDISSEAVLDYGEDVNSGNKEREQPISVSITDMDSAATANNETVYVSISKNEGLDEPSLDIRDIYDDGTFVFSVSNRDGVIVDYKIVVNCTVDGYEEIPSM